MATTPCTTATALVLLAIPSAVCAVGAAINTPFPEGAKLSIALKVNSDSSGVLEIRNDSRQDLMLQELSNRSVLAFLVMDEQGNVLPPSGCGAIVDPAGLAFLLPSNTAHTHRFRDLEFLTGRMQVYVLERGTRYRVVAVYRPGGPNGPGFCSNEYVFQYTGAPNTTGGRRR